MGCRKGFIWNKLNGFIIPKQCHYTESGIYIIQNTNIGILVFIKCIHIMGGHGNFA
jgi:hypothetical protein